MELLIWEVFVYVVFNVVLYLLIYIVCLKFIKNLAVDIRLINRKWRL